MDGKKDDTEFLKKRLREELRRNGYDIGEKPIKRKGYRGTLYEASKDGEEFLVYLHPKNVRRETAQHGITHKTAKKLKSTARDERLLYLFGVNYRGEDKAVPQGIYVFLFDIDFLKKLKRTDKRLEELKDKDDEYLLKVKKLKELQEGSELILNRYYKENIVGGVAGSKGQKIKSGGIAGLGMSDDEIERDLDECLQKWQESKKARGGTRHLGRDPVSIKKHGAVETISRRVRAGSVGFDQVPLQYSYEALVLKYHRRFAKDVVKAAQKRLSEPTDSSERYREVVAILSKRPPDDAEGVENPRKVKRQVGCYSRDPKVGASVQFRAAGNCELCLKPAPFERDSGGPFLEVHHVKHLADGGSDRISNAVAVCPNCHRALHYAKDANERKQKLYDQVDGLVPE